MLELCIYPHLQDPVCCLLSGCQLWNTLQHNNQVDLKLLPHYVFFHYRESIFNSFHFVCLPQDLSKSKWMWRSKNDSICFANSRFEWLNGVKIIYSICFISLCLYPLFLEVLSDMDWFSSQDPLQNKRGGEGKTPDAAGSPTHCPLCLGLQSPGQWVGCNKYHLKEGVGRNKTRRDFTWETAKDNPLLFKAGMVKWYLLCLCTKLLCRLI